MAENSLEPRVNRLETKVSIIETKVDMFIDEMRDRDNRRAAEISEIRQKQEADMKEIRSTFEKMNEKIDKMNDKIDGMNKHVSNLTITAMVGIGAMAAAVVGFIISLAIK